MLFLGTYYNFLIIFRINRNLLYQLLLLYINILMISFKALTVKTFIAETKCT